MKFYESFSSPKGPVKWLLWSVVFILLATLTTFTILEVRSVNSEESSSVLHIILNSLKSTNERNSLSKEKQPINKFVLLNVEGGTFQSTDDLVKAIVTKVEEEDDSSQLQRKARETAGSSNATEKNDKKNSYYEEQTPVVVYAKTDQAAPLAYRQEAPPIPYRLGSHEEQQPYYTDGNSDDDRDFADEAQNYYHPQYDDSSEDFETPQAQNYEQAALQGRSSQGRQYDSYYRQWHYATPPPSPTLANAKSSSSSSFTLQPSSKGNRKLSDMTAPATGGSSDPYDAYLNDYDYMSLHRAPAKAQQYHYPRQHQKQQLQAYRPQDQSSSPQALQNQEGESGEMSFLDILKTLKTMWDLYQSFASAWNSMAEHRNKQEELAKQKYKDRQQQIRINSKKPPKIQSKTKPEGPVRSTKKPTTTTAAAINHPATTNKSPSTDDVNEKSSNIKTKALPMDKVEPRKGSKGDSTPLRGIESLRKKRETATDMDTTRSTDVGEGRYIKGDPLKGYYDFVITEGSYKFWAAFQVGTALLIIYSTFAAIYYSKVNPLVSDYDYTDYLGGGRSLSGGGDLDFVDDEDKEMQHSTQRWVDWMPRTSHSLKFILDAIDKLPLDHQDITQSNGRVAEVEATKQLTENTQRKAM